MVERKVHYKMYKAKKNWVFAGIATAALLGSANSAVHADSVVKPQSSSNDSNVATVKDQQNKQQANTTVVARKTTQNVVSKNNTEFKANKANSQVTNQTGQTGVKAQSQKPVQQQQVNTSQNQTNKQATAQITNRTQDANHPVQAERSQSANTATPVQRTNNSLASQKPVKPTLKQVQNTVSNQAQTKANVNKQQAIKTGQPAKQTGSYTVQLKVRKGYRPLSYNSKSQSFSLKKADNTPVNTTTFTVPKSNTSLTPEQIARIFGTSLYSVQDSENRAQPSDKNQEITNFANSKNGNRLTIRKGDDKIIYADNYDDAIQQINDDMNSQKSYLNSSRQNQDKLNADFARAQANRNNIANHNQSIVNNNNSIARNGKATAPSFNGNVDAYNDAVADFNSSHQPYDTAYYKFNFSGNSAGFTKSEFNSFISQIKQKVKIGGLIMMAGSNAKVKTVQAAKITSGEGYLINQHRNANTKHEGINFASGAYHRKNDGDRMVFYKVGRGTQIIWNHACKYYTQLKDGSSAKHYGKIKLTIKDYTYFNPNNWWSKAHPHSAFIGVYSNRPAINMFAPLKSMKFDIQFLDRNNKRLDTSNTILSFSDVDAGQFIKLDSSATARLYGNNIRGKYVSAYHHNQPELGKGCYVPIAAHQRKNGQSEPLQNAHNGVTTNQAWYLVKNNQPIEMEYGYTRLYYNTLYSKDAQGFSTLPRKNDKLHRKVGWYYINMDGNKRTTDLVNDDYFSLSGISKKGVVEPSKEKIVKHHPGLTLNTLDPLPSTTPTYTEAWYHTYFIKINPHTPNKTADLEGKTLLHGDSYAVTTHIYQDTGVGTDISNYFIGDALLKQNGKVTVDYNTNDWKVYDQNGKDVTNWGHFDEYDANIAGHDAHVVKWTPYDANGIDRNMTYHLDAKISAKNDYSADQDLDIGVTPWGTTEVKGYNEYWQQVLKNWENRDEHSPVNGKVYVDGDNMRARIDMTTPGNLAFSPNSVGLCDDYSRFKDKVTVQNVKVLENGNDVTNQYNISYDDGRVNVSRKDPSGMPQKGQISLITYFGLHQDLPSGLPLQNTGWGWINGQNVNASIQTVYTFKQDVTKHWKEGLTVVDNKTYINQDQVNAEVNMTTPTNLAEPLGFAQLTDDYGDFMDKVDYLPDQTRVYQNGQDVTNNFWIWQSTGDKCIYAKAKDPADIPSGAVLSLDTHFKIHQDVPSGTVFHNSGRGWLNQQCVTANQANVVTYLQDVTKHWKEGAQVVDNKLYIDGDHVNAEVNMSLPHPESLAKPLRTVIVTDNYSKFADKADLLPDETRVYENGQDVTSQYWLDYKDNTVIATRKDPSSAPYGTVSLDIHFHTHNHMPNGQILENMGHGQLNDSQVDAVNATVMTYQQSVTKNWMEDEYSRVVNGKTYINGDKMHTQVSMSLPDPAKLAVPMTHVSLTDNWSQFMRYASVIGWHVMENGQDVTDQYDIDNNTATGLFTVTRKSPQTAPGGSVDLRLDYHLIQDIPNHTELINSSYGQLNTEVVNSNNPDVFTYTQSMDKHWIAPGNQIVDGRTYIDGDEVQANIDMTLPDPTTLARPLDKVQVVDDWSAFNQNVDYDSTEVWENGQDVTDQYTITNDGNFIYATRKNPGSAPGGKVTLINYFHIKNHVPSGTVLPNQGYGVLNTHRVDTERPQIVTFQQVMDKHWVEGQQKVDGKTYINDDQVNASVTMTLPDKDKLAVPLKKVQIVDDYGNFAKNVQSELAAARVYENGQDVTSQYEITDQNNQIIATRKDPSSTPSGIVQLLVHFIINNDVPSGTAFNNNGYGTLNTETVNVPMRTIYNFTPETNKDWIEGHARVNGATYVDGDLVHARVSMTLPDSDQLATELKHVSLTDDYTQFMNYADVASVKVLENDQDVTAQYDITNENGLVTATRRHPGQTPSGQVVMYVDFNLHNNLNGENKGTTPELVQIVNAGNGTLNHDVVPVKKQTITAYQQGTDKHWVEQNTDGTDRTVDDLTYIDGDMVHAKIDMTLPDPDSLGRDLDHVELVDDYSRFASLASFVGAHVYENGKDVTDQYKIYTTTPDSANAGQYLIHAVRIVPDTAPGGHVSLVCDFHTNNGLKNGTLLINAGYGVLNSNIVHTPTPKVVLYQQTMDKHWIEGSQTVDNKTYIDGDIAHGNITMTLPDKNQLAKPLSKVSLDDDYSQMLGLVDVSGAHVYENGKDVTGQYEITYTNGHVTATRKDPADTPSGTVALVVDFHIHNHLKTGTKLINAGSGTINTEKVKTPTPWVWTYQQDMDKHFKEGSQVVDGKTYIDGDTIHGDISMTLPDPKTLAKPLNNVVIDDDYTQMMDKVDYVDAHVFENGKDVTYNYVITFSHGHVTATRKAPALTPGGQADLKVDFHIHNHLANGTKLVNGGSGTINTEKVKTPTPSVTVYQQKMDKHWVEGSQTVDDKTYISGDTAHAKIDMSLPDPITLAHKLSKVGLTEDYRSFKDLVDLAGVHVLENGQDVTSAYTIQRSDGMVYVQRKDASTTPNGNVSLVCDFHIHNGVANGTQLINHGSGLINTEVVYTPTPKIVTYRQTIQKNWVEGSQTVNDKTYIGGDLIHGKIDMTLPDKDQLAKPLSKVALMDDYTNFRDKVDYLGAHVFENGKDVTNQYNISQDWGHVYAYRKDASQTPSGSVSLVVDFKIHDDVPSGTEMFNTGSGTLNTETVPTNKPKIITYIPKTDKNWVDGQGFKVNVNGKNYIDGDTIHANITMTLPKPIDMAHKLQKVQLDDNYSLAQQYLDFKDAHVYENGQDVTDQYNIAVANGHVTATRKDPSSAPAGTVAMLTDFVIRKNAPDGVTIRNSGSGTLDNDTVYTPSVDVHTKKQKTIKHWVEENGQIVDGKTYVDGDNATANISMTLPDQLQLAQPLNYLAVEDDYSKFAQYVDFTGATIFENGEDVTGQYNISAENGHVLAVRKNPSGAPAGEVVMHVGFKIHDNVPNGVTFMNNSNGYLNHEVVPSVPVPITPHNPTPDKHWVEGTQNVDDKTYVDGDEVHGQVSMQLPDRSALAKPLNHVELADNYSNFKDKVDYLGSHVLENGLDVTDQYDISVDRNQGLIIATRKNPAGAPSGAVMLVSDFKIHDDVASGTNLVNSGFGILNSDKVSTPDRTIHTFKQNSDKHWTAGDQNVDGRTFINDDVVSARVSMTLPDQGKLAKKLSRIELDDNYSKFADKVDVVGVTVLENGQDVTGQYDIHVSNGHVIAERRNAKNAPSGTVILLTKFKLHDNIPSGTTLLNSGSGTIDDETVPTPDQPIHTYKTDSSKHWELNGQVTDNKLYLAGDNAVAGVQVNLPDAKQLGEKLYKVAITDDYSKFSDKVDFVSARVFENGKDVTGLYNIVNFQGHVVATRKDASTTPSGIAKLLVTFHIHDNVPTGTVLANDGSVTINSDTVKVPETPVVVYHPNAHKDVALGYVDGQITNSINGKMIADGSILTYGLTSDDLPANRADDIKSRYLVDRLPQNTDFKGFKAWLWINGRLTDVTSHIQAHENNGTVTFTDDSWLLNYYNSNKDKTTPTPIIDMFVQVHGSHKDFKNSFDLVVNGHKVSSNTVDNFTSDNPVPVKQDLNEKGVNIDGQTVRPGSTNVYKLTWDFSRDKGIQADDALIKQGFYFVDDFPDKALKFNLKDFKVVDENGNIVKGISVHVYKSIEDAPKAVQDALRAKGYKTKGKIIVWSADNPEEFFKDYVQTGKRLYILAPMKVKQAFSGKYSNQAFQIGLGEAEATNIVFNNVKKSKTPQNPNTPNTPEKKHHKKHVSRKHVKTPKKTPKSPKVPGTPKTPGTSRTPRTPNNPRIPRNPQTPQNPRTPNKPNVPLTPRTPVGPNEPQTPNEGVPAVNNQQTIKANSNTAMPNKHVLPQTGEQSENSMVLGLLSLLVSMELMMLGVDLKKRRN